MLDTRRDGGIQAGGLNTGRFQPKELRSRVFIAITASSRLQLPARSPMPLIVHSICPSASTNGGEAVGNGHAEIVVAVHAQVMSLIARHVLLSDNETSASNSRRYGIANGIRNIDGRRAGFDCRRRRLRPNSRARFWTHLPERTLRHRKARVPVLIAPTALLMISSLAILSLCSR